MERNSDTLMPPVGPYSPPGAIRDWMRELQSRADTLDVKPLMDQARKWLEIQESYISIV